LNADGKDYLVLKHPIVRFIYGATPERNAISPQFLASVQQPSINKLRILLIASNTKPAIPGVDAEIELLSNLFEQFDFVEVTKIPTNEASCARVERELACKNYDIVHYAGHGFFDWTNPESSHLVFWKEKNYKGGTVYMSSNQLNILLKSSAVRFFFLSCCNGTDSGNEDNQLDDDFLGIADAVIHSGVPTVLGYRWPVSDQRAIELAAYFYRSLLRHGRPDLALWQARTALYASNPNDMTYISPIMIHQV
jgi:CHAT domain-containing protein